MSGAAPLASPPPLEGQRPFAWSDFGWSSRWIRTRVGLVTTGIILIGMVTLDFVLAVLLPVPPVVASLARGDVLLFGPLAIGGALGAVFLELRSVSRVCATGRLGLRVAEEDRVRALRAARSFPVELAAVVLLIATLGNTMTALLDLHGRSPTVWHSLLVSTVAQCVVLCFSTALFLHARFALRPVVYALSRPGDPLVGGLGLRGRVGLLVGGLVAAVTLSGASYAALRQDAMARRLALARHRLVVGLLAREVEEAGPAALIRRVSQVGVVRRDDPGARPGAAGSGGGRLPDGRLPDGRLPDGRLPDGSRPFVQVTPGRTFPSDLGRVLRRARLPAVSRGQTLVLPVGIYQHVVARSVVLPAVPRGTPHMAWVGVVSPPDPARPDLNRLILLVLSLLALSLVIGLAVGAGLAAEVRALSGRVASQADRAPPDRLPPEVGSVAEVRSVVVSVNDLLAATGRSELERYVAAEHTLEKTQTRTQILANMSHDLKAPLTSIIGFVELIQAETSGRLNRKQKERMAVVASAGRDLQNLLDVLLDAAKLGVGRLRLERGWTPPATLVSGAMNRLAELAGEGVRQEVRVALQPGLFSIYVDPGRTAQAIAQLLALLRSVARPVSPDVVVCQEPPLSLRVGRYTARGDRGVEIVVACRDTGSVDPTQIDLLAVLDPPGVAVPSRVPRFRPGAELARAVLTRQHARIIPFRSPAAGARAAAGPGGEGAAAPSRAVGREQDVRTGDGTRSGSDAGSGSEPGSGYRIRFSFATAVEMQAVVD